MAFISWCNRDTHTGPARSDQTHLLCERRERLAPENPLAQVHLSPLGLLAGPGALWEPQHSLPQHNTVFTHNILIECVQVPNCLVPQVVVYGCDTDVGVRLIPLGPMGPDFPSGPVSPVRPGGPTTPWGPTGPGGPLAP